MYILIIILVLIFILYERKETILFTDTNFAPFLEEEGIVVNDKKKVLEKIISSKKKTVYYGNQFNSLKGISLAKNKFNTKKVLDKYNIPNPKGVLWNSKISVFKNIKGLKFPLVAKPVDGSQGTDVFVCDTLRHLLNSIALIRNKTGNKVLVEEFIHGGIYRILVFNGKIIDILKREPQYIIGDNYLSVVQLINNIKKTNTHSVKDVDYNYIKKQGFLPDSIIAYNKKVYITRVANLHNGAHNHVISMNNIHPVNIELFKFINKITNLNLNGIDYITDDISKPYYTNGHILELNSGPGIAGHIKNNPQSIRNLVKQIF